MTDAAPDRVRPEPLPSDDEAWRRLPEPSSGRGSRLPSWARALADPLPRTTASLLQLDAAQRTAGPIPPHLRVAMRHIAAVENRCDYAMAYAAADAAGCGIGESRLDAAGEGGKGWSEAERTALRFARTMTLDSDSVTDDEFARLVAAFGERAAASMVLLLAHANFQDRLLLCLGSEVEPDGPLLPSEARFDPSAFTSRTTPPPPTPPAPPQPAGRTVVAPDGNWSRLSYDDLQERLELQRNKPTRLPIPAWDDFAGRLPSGLFDRPSDIVWYRLCFGYAPELAVPFEYFMRTAGAETSDKWDRVFGQSLFWVTTRSVVCPYCMGHCEMNWEVAGLTPAQIADRSRLLAGDDWSAFPAEQQQAFAFARKLARAPWSISDEDLDALRRGFGPDRALVTVLHTCRHHYMVRISNGFQLRLERENVFYDYYSARRPAPAGDRADR